MLAAKCCAIVKKGNNHCRQKAIKAKKLPFAPFQEVISCCAAFHGRIACRVSKPRWSDEMSLRINDIAPDFTADTTDGKISFHEWIGDGYAVLFSHPKDFTPVCTTELGYMAGLAPEFSKRNAKIIGISVDPVENHLKWKDDISKATGHAVRYPMIGDPQMSVAKLYDMLPASASGDAAARTPADNQTVRSVFVIGPDKKIKLILTYPMTTGRNFEEILRAIDSIQLTAKHQVATPAGWKQGEDVIITAAVSDDDAQKRFGGFERVLPYLRKTAQPSA
jgi:alkyl hydroperoxide reductase subunit AhpC